MNKHQIRSTWKSLWILALVCASLPAAASEISGLVINKTREKPASGDEVVLLSLAQGMQESARTKADAQGRFKLSVPDEGVQHLIRVVHEGVNYHKPVPQGSGSLNVEVYDVAKQVEKIFGEGRVLRLQTTNGQLLVSEMYILRNESTPPRTQMSERSFEVTVPDGAEDETGMAAGPGGMPVKSAPVPTGEKNHYAFIFPIRPGRTQFQITYHMSYNGNRAFDLNFDMPFAELGVMLPKSMQFKASGDAFQEATDESGMNTYVVKSVSRGQHIAFAISGEGSAPTEVQASGVGMSNGPPGGGLGAPITGENPLGASTAWYFLGGLAIVVVCGAYFVTHRPNSSEQRLAADATDIRCDVPGNRVAPPTRNPSLQSHPAATRSNFVLDLLKEELFQIETEKLEGKISEQQYNEIRTGINALMRRHVARHA